ncbi:DUF3817 domain-containing protein [Glaciecola siphonariae]|uniref:DUF3817 domain-containing protein n=1 Tax=Glaciecola siphonariae TaxID=521012 RepID=A0ABV9LRH5_9ALTE
MNQQLSHKSSGKTLRVATLFEAITLVVLVCAAVPIKYLLDYALLTKVMGPVHGIAFIFFNYIVLRTWSEGLLKGEHATRLMIGAMIPFGGFVNERWLKRELQAKDAI